MGNQNSVRLVPSEKTPKGPSLSGGPSPKKLSASGKDGVNNGKKLELSDRPRRNSDSTKSSKSRSPSPTAQKQSRFTIKRIEATSISSPRAHHKRQPSLGDTLSRPRTPRMAFRKFREDFNISLLTMSGRRSRRQSGDQELPLSFKISVKETDNTPSIPTDEIFKPKTFAEDTFDPSSPSSNLSYRARASTISNGHVSRLKILMEGEEGSEDTYRNGRRRPGATKGPRPLRKKKIPTVFRYYLGKNNKIKTEKVFIAGTMTNWRAVEMVKPKGDLDFVLIIDCSEGDHFFKFNVDGVWKIDDHQEKATGRGDVEANIIRVKKSDAEVLDALACDSFTVKSSKNEGIVAQTNWGQVKPKWDSISKTKGPPTTSRDKGTFNPPYLPPQLLTNFLNKESEGYSDPNLLPEPPTHVILNHLYAQSVKDNVLVLATTTRFRKKYATVVLYKPVD